MNAAASWPCRLVVPTKMAKARCLEIEREATRIAIENEKTMPMLAKVRSIPEAMPKTSGGEAFIRAGVGGEEGARADAVQDAGQHDQPQPGAERKLGVEEQGDDL